MVRTATQALAVLIISIIVSFSFVTCVSVVVEKHNRTESYRGTNNQGANASENKDNKGFWRVFFHDPTAFFTGVLAIFTIVLACATIELIIITQRGIREQAGLTRETLTFSSRVTIANEESAEIARSAMIASNRPYVRHNIIRYYSHKDISGGFYFWSIRPQWINAGNTPTKGANFYIGFSLLPNEIGYGFDFPCEGPLNTDIFQGAVIQTGIFNIKDSQLVDINNGRLHFYVYGYVIYRDRFAGTPFYITRFCVKAFRIDGNVSAQWDAINNPVEIHFGAINRFNCYDEACGELAGEESDAAHSKPRPA